MNASDRIKTKRSGSGEPGLLERFFTSYESQNERFERSFFPWLLQRAPIRRGIARIRRAVASSVENSLIVRAAAGLARHMTCMTLRAYGTFLMSAGLYIAVVYVIKSISSTLSPDIDDIITAAILSLISIPLLASGKTLSAAVCSSRAASFIAFEVLGFRPEAARAEKAVYKRCDTALVAGMITGLLSFYIEPLKVIFTIAAALLLYIILTKPEAGVVLLYAAFPFFQAETLRFYISFVFAAYFIKLICGRRTFKLDLADTLMLIFAVLFSLGGAVSYGGQPSGGLGASYMSVYFLSCLLLTDDKWRIRCRRALVSGGAALAVVYIASGFTDIMSEQLAGISSAVLLNAAAHVTAVTSVTGETAVYLAMTLPVMITSILNKRGGAKPFRMTLFSVVTAAAIIYTLSRGIWLGAIAGVIMLLIMINIKFILLPAGGLCAAGAAMLLFPDSIGGYIMRLLDMTGSATVSRIAVRRNSFRIFADNMPGGIGSGEGVFSSIYQSYASVGDTAADSQSLYLQIGVELGIFGLAAFLIAMAAVLMKAATNARRAPDASVRRNACAGIAGLTAAFTCGVTSYIWAEPEMLMLFFMFAAFVSSYNTRKPDKTAAMTAEFGVRENIGAAEIDIAY